MARLTAERRVGWNGAVHPARRPARARRRAFVEAAVAAALMVAVALALAPAASAHADLVSVQPGPGTRLGSSPTRVVLTFSENVNVAASVLTIAQDGQAPQRVALVATGSGSTTMEGTLPATLKPGPVYVSWRSVAADDGHVTSGAFQWIGPDAVPGPSAPAPAPNRTARAGPDLAGVQGTFAFVRLLNYLALAVLCGGLVFVGLIWPGGADARRTHRVLLAACAVGGVTSVLGLGFEGATILQKPLLSAIAPSVIGQSLSIQFGRVWAGKGLLFLLAVPIVWALRVQGERAARNVAWRVGAAAVGLALIRTPGLVAHSEHGPHPDVGSVADLLHLTGVTVWFGGLVFLAAVVLPRRDPSELEVVIPRFSAAAKVSVAAVVLGGLVLSWQLVGSTHGLFTSSFGHVLMAKLVVFGFVMAAAQASRAWVGQKLRLAVVLEGDRTVLRPFVVSVATEVVLATALLAIASVLVNTNPVR